MRVGDINEQIAITECLKAGWDVFKNVSAAGPVDMCIFNIEKNIFYYIDVKSFDLYKHIEVYLKSRADLLTPKQIKMGVKVAFYFDKRLHIVIDKENKHVLTI